MRKEALTARETEVLGFLYRFPRDPSHPYPPTYREIAETFGVSIGTVQGWTENLRRQNLITWVRNSPRTFSLTLQGVDYI